MDTLNIIGRKEGFTIQLKRDSETIEEKHGMSHQAAEDYQQDFLDLHDDDNDDGWQLNRWREKASDPPRMA